MARVMIRLDEQENKALWQLAETERRDWRDQAALIIRAELERRGLIATEHAERDAAQTVGAQNATAR